MRSGQEFCINSRIAQKSTLFFSLRYVITPLISQRQISSYKYHLMLVPGVKKLSGWNVFSGQRLSKYSCCIISDATLPKVHHPSVAPPPKVDYAIYLFNILPMDGTPEKEPESFSSLKNQHLTLRKRLLLSQ